MSEEAEVWYNRDIRMKKSAVFWTKDVNKDEYKKIIKDLAMDTWDIGRIDVEYVVDSATHKLCANIKGILKVKEDFIAFTQDDNVWDIGYTDGGRK